MATVLGFNGSPRIDGNTDRLVKAVLAGAADAGAAIVHRQLSGMSLAWCAACMACREKAACVIQDDMSKVVQEILQADALVLGSPVYMWQMSGQAKTFMDRLYPVLNADFTTRLTQRPKMILAFTQGHPEADYFKPYFDQTRAVLEFLGFRVVDIISAVGTRAPDDIEKQPDVLARARDLGGSLV